MRHLLLAVLATCAAGAPEARAVEFDLGAGAGVVAPLSDVLRRTGPGMGVTAETTVGVLPYLAVGARYSLAAFFQDTVDASGNENEPILDHGASAVVRFTIVGGFDNGWMNEPGGLSGRLWVDLGLGYHMIGREGVFGLDAALGYTFRPGPHCRIGPAMRVSADFGTSEGEAVYLGAFLDFGYDLGWLFEDDEAEEAGPAAGYVGQFEEREAAPSGAEPGYYDFAGDALPDAGTSDDIPSE